MPSSLKSLLENLGLSKREADVYLALARTILSQFPAAQPKETK